MIISAGARTGVVLVLLPLNPAKPLIPVFVLLALAVAFAVVPRIIRW